jgi:hypothetical protein
MPVAVATHDLIAALQLARSDKEGVKFLAALAEALTKSPKLATLELIEALYDFVTRRSYQPARGRGVKALAAAVSAAAPCDAGAFVRTLSKDLVISASRSDRAADTLRRKAFSCVLAICDRNPEPLANDIFIASLVRFAGNCGTQRHFAYRVLESIVSIAPEVGATIVAERDAQLGRRANSNYSLYDQLTKIAGGLRSTRRAPGPTLSDLTAELARLSVT